MTSPSPTSSLGPEQQALSDALRAEHAAVYAYGLIAAFSNPARIGDISADAAAHRARRDATIDALTAAKVRPEIFDMDLDPCPVRGDQV